MKQAGQAPNLTHANAATICAMALKAMGLDAHRGVDFRDGYDFLVNGKVRIAVRYAIPTADREQTYHAVGVGPLDVTRVDQHARRPVACLGGLDEEIEALLIQRR